MKQLTRIQEEVYCYIEEFLLCNVKSPKYREIKARFGFKHDNQVAGILMALEKKGFIHRPPGGKARNIHLVRGEA